jgi:hypothetical protein
VLEREPAACGQSLIAVDFLLGKVAEFAVIAGEDSAETKAVLEMIASSFRPQCVVAPATFEQAASLSQNVALLSGRSFRDHQIATYICQNYTCQAPIVGVEELKNALAATKGRE